MTTTWKPNTSDDSHDRKSSAPVTSNTISGSSLTSWSRQQKFAMIASFTLLAVLLVVTACSKQSPKPALAAVSGPAISSSAAAASANATIASAAATTAAPVSGTTSKKVKKQRPANVTYSDPNAGVSFLYPRKFALTSGRDANLVPEQNEVPMNFVQAGGVAVAIVALPDASYSGTDFESASFNVNINRGLSEQECSHFAFVDTNNADGEPVDAENVKVGPSDVEMEKTSTFSAGMMKQKETQYYHRFENGACYEYVLSLATGGYGAKNGIEPVNREDVFVRLEKILDSVKISRREGSVTEQLTAQTPTKERPVTAGASGKE